MATANGNTVSGGSTSAGTAYSWRCVVEIVVASESATQVKYTVRLKYYTRYAINVYSNGKLSGGASGSWSGSMTSSSNSGKTTTVITKSVTVNKGSSSKSFSVSGQIQNTGGFGNGTSKATCKVTVPAIDYSAPNAPSSCAASRVSDSQAKATWTNGSTSTTRPRSSTKVERQTDSGSWTQIASVGASTANYTDNGISANHRYRYRVRAQGSGGYSGYSTSGYIYTTPAAPTAVELVKTSDTQVQVSIQGAAPWADSYKLQRSVDSGAWADVASVTSWPYVDTPGGGMVKYRVAAVKGSLQSAWAESAEIATITPPLAPSVALSPADAVLPVGTAVTVSWTPDHPDGSAQSSAQVEYTVAGSATTATVTGASTTYALPATALDAPATVSVRVRTKGLDPDWGAWSSPAQLTLAYPPSVSITNPGIDGATVSELPLVARWAVDDSTGVAEQQLRLYEDGALVHTAQLSTDARSYEFGDSTYRLDNKTDYSIELTVRGGSTLAVTETRGFATDFAQPEAPEGLLSIDHGDLSVSIEVQAGASQSDEGNPVEVVGREGVAMSGLTVYGATRQNLWMQGDTAMQFAGVTITPNEDGSVTASGTSTTSTDSGGVWSNDIYVLKQGATYTLSVNAYSGKCVPYMQFYEPDGTSISGSMKTLAAGATSVTFAVGDTWAFCRMGFLAREQGAASGTYRVMLNEGTTAEPWCPPGIHGVEELGLVTAGRNLLSFRPDLQAETKAGITFTPLDDGGVLVSGTATSAAYYNLDFAGSYLDGVNPAPKGARVVSSGRTDGINLAVSVFVPGGSYEPLEDISAYSGVVPEYAKNFRCYLSVSQGTTINNVVYPQIELGAIATVFERPQVTQTPIDLQGNALNSLPDGTRDELHVDSSGAVEIGAETWKAVIPSDVQDVYWDASMKRITFTLDEPAPTETLGHGSILCDVVPPRPSSQLGSEGTYCIVNGATAYIRVDGAESASDVVAKVGGGTILYPLANEQTIELGSIEMPAYTYDTSYVSIASDIPTTLRVGYPVTSSLTVERQLPDGTRWTVGADLSDGEECIDPLPPLNLDYQYLVTASTEAGAAATTNVDARVESNAAAFNFGSDASTCELLRLDPSWSRSPSIATELYDFADGGEAGGLPMAYTTDSLTVSGQESATTLDEEQYRRLLAIARRYAVGWVRDQLGGRQYCALAWYFSGGVPRRLVECSVDMSEIRWREAW